MLRRVNPLMQTFRRVVVQDRHGLLADDWSGINSGIHKMHRAACHLHAVIQRLLPRFESGE